MVPRRGAPSWMALLLITASLVPAEHQEQVIRNSLETQLFRTQANCCGVIAMYLVLGRLGKETELSKLFELLPMNANGTSMAQMQNCFRGMGLAAEGVEMNIQQLREILTSATGIEAIALVDEDHWVVVVPGPRHSWYIYDYPNWRLEYADQFVTRYSKSVLLIAKEDLRETLGTTSSRIRYPIWVDGIVFLGLVASLVRLYPYGKH